jgi:hypothetical protein
MESDDTNGEVKFFLGSMPKTARDFENHPLIGPSVDAFHRRMTAGLPEGTDIHLRLSSCNILNMIEFQYTRAGVGRNDHFFQAITFQQDAAEFSIAQMTSSLQGRGIGPTIHARMLSLYGAGGVSRLKMMAEKINPYAAAQLGFKPYARDWREYAARNIVQRLDVIEGCLSPMHGALPAPVSDAIRAAAGSSDPAAIWEAVDARTPVAGVPLGKLLTIDALFLPERLREEIRQRLPQDEKNPFSMCGYNGTFDLADDASMKRMTAVFARRRICFDACSVMEVKRNPESAPRYSV